MKSAGTTATNITSRPLRRRDPQEEEDRSDALFSMYLNRSISKDREMVDIWKGDADNILVFVGLQTTSHTSAYNVEFVDWCILCYGRGITHIIRPEYSAELAGHLSFLSRANPSATFYPTDWVTAFHPVELVQPHRAIHSAYVRRLG
jgi:Family of unknown function (DUF6535)